LNSLFDSINKKIVSRKMTEFPDLHSPPDAIYFDIENEKSPFPAKCIRAGLWEGHSVQLSMESQPGDHIAISVHGEELVRRVILRWDKAFSSETRFLGDAWERSYGDLEWRGVVPYRLMPWYFLASHRSGIACYGVETNPSALACWTVDSTGFSLHLDLRCGGTGVDLRSRRLHVVTLVQQLPATGGSTYADTRAFCKELCPRHLTPEEPIVGHNDWYWLYGKNSDAQIMEATMRFMDLYPAGTSVRPWSIVDDGWQTQGKQEGLYCNGGPWTCGNDSFPDMAYLAKKIKALGARPGIWMRPLKTKENVPDQWKIQCPKPFSQEGGYSLDPSVPEVLELVSQDVRRLRDWGYELIKHDFSTYDLTGRWGFEMNLNSLSFAPDGWSFGDRTKTTAEIISALNRTLREAAGENVALLGCNTVSHLAAGYFEIQRTGDDTSASDWNRTLRMGVNTLAFRSNQHDAFYAVDADCVPISPRIPYRLSNQWVDLISRSGTPLFLSIDPSALTELQKKVIRESLEVAVMKNPPAEPIDWFDCTTPARWNLQNKEATYDWSEWSTGTTPLR
jgi:alpha-galactosidase